MFRICDVFWFCLNEKALFRINFGLEALSIVKTAAIRSLVETMLFVSGF